MASSSTESSIQPVRGQEEQYQKLLGLMRRTSFVTLVAGPPGSGKKSMVRRAALECDLTPQDLDLDRCYTEQDVSTLLGRLSGRALGDQSSVAWLLFNAELVEARPLKGVKDLRMAIMAHDATPSLRQAFAPLYFNRLSTYSVTQILRDEHLSADDAHAIARACGGDLNQALLAARFTSGPKETTPHAYFDTKALLNGGSVEADKLSLPWTFANGLAGCVDLDEAAKQAASFCHADLLREQQGIWTTLVHKAVRGVRKRNFVQTLDPPVRLSAPDPLARRCWSYYGSPLATLDGTVPNPLKGVTSIEGLLMSRAVSQGAPESKRQRTEEPAREDDQQRTEGRRLAPRKRRASRSPSPPRKRRASPSPPRRHRSEGEFQVRFNPDRFEEKDFVGNDHVCPEDLEASLNTYLRWLSRFFVCITDGSSAMVAQVFYFPGTDRVQDVVCRSPQQTAATFPTMPIVVGADRKKQPVTAPLLSWYTSSTRRRTARRVNMWTTPEDIEANEHDLNTFGGLRFDERLQGEGPLEITAFSDPFPAGALPRAALGLPARHVADEWRSLEGLLLIQWHLKYVLCGGDAEAFGYLMQWFGYILQRRSKPGVMPQFLGEEGIGKSAILGHNQSGPGLLKRIYGQYYQWTDDIDSLLGKFNKDSSNRLFCLMEEAGTYRKGFRNNEKLKSRITEGTLIVELKGVDAIEMNDHRAFALCTNNRDSLKITPGARRFLCLEGSDFMSQKAVDEGRTDKLTRREYMAKLDKTKNDDEVAYAFFRYCMCLDLSDFAVSEPPRTELFREQQSHNECILKQFLEQVGSGEYPLLAEHVQGECTLSAREVYERLRAFSHDTGAYMNLDSSIAVGCALAHRYAALAPKVPGRVPKYRLQVGART